MKRVASMTRILACAALAVGDAAAAFDPCGGQPGSVCGFPVASNTQQASLYCCSPSTPQCTSNVNYQSDGTFTAGASCCGPSSVPCAAEKEFGGGTNGSCCAGLYPRCGVENGRTSCVASDGCNEGDTNCRPVPPDAGSPPRCDDECCSLPGLGDPIDPARGTSFLRAVDFELKGPQAPLKFIRTYSGYPDYWTEDQALHNVPKPFGGASRAPWRSLEWWHNYLALVTEDRQIWNVRARDGSLLRFKKCSDGVPCWAEPFHENRSLPDRFRRVDGGFELWQANGERLVFDKPHFSGLNGTSTRYFLGAVVAVDGTPIVEVAYQQPPHSNPIDGGCYTGNPDAGSAPGVPFIYELRAQMATVRFEYDLLASTLAVKPECVIRRISLVDPASGSTTSPALVEYEYAGDTQERPGRLSSAAAAGKTLTYTYATGLFSQYSGGYRVSEHSIDGGRVWGDVSSEGTLNVAWGTGSCVSGSDCCGETPKKATAASATAQRGDGVAGSAGLTSEHLTLGNINKSYVPRLYLQTDTCAFDGGCSAGTKQWEWTCSTDAGFPGYERGFKNKRDNWELYGWAAVDGGMPNPIMEKRSVSRGNSSLTANDGLETVNYSYVYGDGYQQLLHATTKPSAISSGNSLVTKNWYDSGNHLIKVTQSGYTADYYGLTPRIVATFRSTSRTCGGSAGPDALNRDLEVRGPCVVSSESDTSCSGAHPVTVYEYYSPTTSSFDRGQLYKVHRYVGGSDDCSSGTPLTTTYGSYDGQGHPGSVTDENSNVTTYAYDSAGRVTARTLGGNTTRYAYDNDKLTAVMYPQGNGEVSCYRTSGNDNCTTGSFTPLLQWKAKKACTWSGSAVSCSGGWSERVNYTYAADGTVSQEDFRVCESGTCNAATDGALRRVMKYSNDAHKRNTWRGVGDATGQYTSVSFFDRADNLAAVGHARNDAPAFCGGPNTGGSLPDEPLSKLCAALKYDRAERLASMTEYETTSSSGSMTCFGYDGQGNLTTVHSGCTSACGSDGVCTSQGSSKAAQYVWDDFGNVVYADLPWTNDGSGGKGRWRYLPDARGNIVYRFSPQQQALSYEYTQLWYDMLNRLTLERASLQSGTATIGQFFYDSASAPTNCPGPFTNTNGRIVMRRDGYGDTYFSYDPEGRVLSEIRLRYPTTECTTGSYDYRLFGSPHTQYTYTANGNLKTIQYPHERTVEYVYGTGADGGAADGDRVTAVKVSRRLSGAWQTPEPVIQNVQWEPYGGLRGYQVTPPDGGSFTVEYRQGDNGESAPPSSVCTASWGSPTSDHTGRLRALWVSSGLQSMGSGSGDIYRRWYQWRADVPKRIDSCLLQESTPRTSVYEYDNQLRLTMVDAGYPSGAFGLTGFAYDSRGNRTSMTQSGASTVTTSSTLASNGDLLSATSRNDSPNASTRTYTWNRNGRLAGVSFGPNSDGADSYTPGYFYGEDGLFRTLSIGGATYSYGYDAHWRRVLKQYPSGATDEYFYDLGHQLLDDRGSNHVTVSVDSWPIDSYVWLDGRPVVQVRSKIANNWILTNDVFGADCMRNDESQACGFYFPVTDHLGAPVLMLDWEGRVTGTSEYEAFGYPNRGALSATTGSQPYSANVNTVLGSFQVANGASGTKTDVRVKFGVFETEATNDYVRLEEQSGASGANKSGGTNGPSWSQWLTLTSSGTTKTVDVRFVSNSNSQSAGAVAEAFEYRRYESTASPFFTPLRFPGQYHDDETDFFENWNRYYEPTTGRYLQPEPLLRDPLEVMLAATRGYSMPAYSYASSSPMHFVDPTGLQAVDSVTATCSRNPAMCEAALGAATAAAMKAATPVADDRPWYCLFFGIGCTPKPEDPPVSDSCEMAKGGKQKKENEYTRAAQQQPDPCEWLRDQYARATDSSERMKIKLAQKVLGCRHSSGGGP